MKRRRRSMISVTTTMVDTGTLLWLLVAALTTTVGGEDPRVAIGEGVIVGRAMTTVGGGNVYHAYQGIPYAKPPVGDLRFMPPEPHPPWQGIFNATDDTKKCPQRDAIFDEYVHGVEDCLVLNVYTPATSNHTTMLPVMFWIHGGGFTSGSGGTDLFGPDYFIDEQVIVVTINYRLGALGFLNLEDDVITGNMGLKDVIMALRWVQRNIATFGGDSNAVTVFGNNAGGVTVSLLIHSPMAKGLFSKVICQSGVAKLPQLFNPKIRQRAFVLAKLLRKDPSDSHSLLKDFKKLEPFEFIKATPKTFDSTEVRDTQKNVLPFGPSVEKSSNDSAAFLTHVPEAIDDMNDFNIPMMIGFNSREAIVYLKTLINDPNVLNNLNYNFQFSIPFRGLEFVYNSDTYKRVAEDIRKFYFEDGIIGNTTLERFVDYVSDSVFYPVDKTLDAYVKIAKSPVYYYRFGFDGALNYYKNAVLDANGRNISGASNGDEICYMFKCNVLGDVYEKMHSTNSTIGALLEKERQMVVKIVRMWTNFAKYGNPSPQNDDILQGLLWKPASKRNHDFLDITNDLKMDKNPNSQNVAFWDGIYRSYAGVRITSTIKTEL